MINGKKIVYLLLIGMKEKEVMNKKQIKLENAERINELNPFETLKKLGVNQDHVICDVGAGSGIFTIPAAKITKNTVYAAEISDEMLAVIKEKAKEQELDNIQLIKVIENKIEIKKESVDLILMVTVLHEIENSEIFLKEIETLINSNGKIAVIEFHKKETPMGPPTAHRMSKEEVSDQMKTIGYSVLEYFDLGENFYCMVFQK